MAKHVLDRAKAEDFSARMVGVLNDAALALMTSVGHQAGIFDAMEDLPASTSEEIARAAGLNERYVREWLGAMVTGRVIEYDATSRSYALPAEHAASLTRAAGVANLSIQMRWIACMGGVEEGIVESFRKGGGVPYSAYSRFHEIMAEESGQVIDAALVQKTLPLVPGLVERLTRGIDVLDVGCGSGHAINVMARAFPHSRFTGYELSEEGVAAGRAEAEASGLPNAAFEVRDVESLGEPAGFDLVTAFDAIHDQAQPTAVLAGIAAVLHADGTFLMVDIAASSELAENLDHPLAPFLYSISTMHCMTVSLARQGEGLGTMWGEQKAREMLAAAGFQNVAVHRVDGDILNSYFVASKT
ncbi:MAG: class I SAM-dependent methyltransferase [Myxococcota bacterium]